MFHHAGSHPPRLLRQPGPSQLLVAQRPLRSQRFYVPVGPARSVGQSRRARGGPAANAERRTRAGGVLAVAPTVDQRTRFTLRMRLLADGAFVYGERRDLEIWPSARTPIEDAGAKDRALRPGRRHGGGVPQGGLRLHDDRRTRRARGRPGDRSLVIGEGALQADTAAAGKTQRLCRRRRPDRRPGTRARAARFARPHGLGVSRVGQHAVCACAAASRAFGRRFLGLALLEPRPRQSRARTRNRTAAPLSRWWTAARKPAWNGSR